MREYDLKKALSTGSYTRNSIKPQLLVAEDGEYRQGDILDANATMEVVSSTASDIDDKINDILGVDNGAVQELVGILSDSDTTTGILNELAKKANISDLETVAGDIPQVPTNVSAFTNDAGYLTQHQDISGKANSSDLSTVATSGSYNDLSNKPHIPEDPVQSDWTENDVTDQAYIKNKPNLATVATTGDYTDLSNKPTIPAAQIQSDWAQDDNTLADYIKNKPNIPDTQVLASWTLDDYTQADFIKNKPDYSKALLKPVLDITTTNSNGHDYIEFGGVKWATMNVGAQTVTDYGEFFQWGDTQGYTADQCGNQQGKKKFDWSDYKYRDGVTGATTGTQGFTKYTSADGLTQLEIEDDAVRSNWGGNWRMPTAAEFQALDDATDGSWTNDYEGTGVSGLILTDKVDQTKKIFFPAAGDCWYGTRNAVGTSGMYWSSSLKTSYVPYSYNLHFDNHGLEEYDNEHFRYNGFPVRGVLDGTVQPNQASVVAITGDYNDLKNKPTIPAEQIQSDWNQSDTTAKDYIKNKPTIPTIEGIIIANGHEYVDLGLPSGTKWAKCNVGADSETGYGNYYGYGKGSTLYNYGDSAYSGTENPLALNADTAAQVMGGDWRTPTKELFEELLANTTLEWTTINNVYGTKLTASNNNYIFFPAAGWKDSGSVSEQGAASIYWSSTPTVEGRAYGLYLRPGTNDFLDFFLANAGRSVRGVIAGNDTLSNATLSQSGLMSSADKTKLDELSTVATTGSYNDLTDKPTIPTKVSDLTNNSDFLKNPHISNGHEYVEIAGMKWATMNIGATSATNKGLYFSWGETVGYPYNTSSDAKSFSLSDYKYAEFDGSDYIYTKYNDTDQKTLLDLEDDPARVNWGGNWRMPTEDEFKALIAACDIKILLDDGTTTLNTTPSGKHSEGIAFIDKTDPAKYIIFPFSQREKDGHGPTSTSDAANMLSLWLNKCGYTTHKGYETVACLVYTNGVWDRYVTTDTEVVYAGLPVRPILDEQYTPSTVAEVAITGDYNDLVNKPEIIRVVEITGNLSNQTTSITGILNDGKKETVIYINNTENTYYITVSNSYKTLRNTQLSLVACPGGYCEVSYTNKGGIIFAKGLVMGVRQSDSNSKYILATYDVTNTNTATPLIYSGRQSAYADMEIDGVLLPSPVASYTFDTVGEHTVKFILPDLEQFDEQNGIKFGWMDTGNKLKSIVLPEGITTIPDLAFYACQSLESVTLPSTIRTIGNEAFGSYWRVYSGSGTRIGCDKLSSINIPNGVTSIGYNCFVGCASLTNITIPDSVTSLGYSSFSQCTGLTTVSLGTGLTILQQEMFRGCTSLTDVTISNTTTSILKGAFCGCSSLQTIVIPDSVTELGGIYAYLHDYEGVFAYCTSLTNVTLSNNLGTLRGNMFCNCTSLLTLNIPDKLQSIDATALIGCSNLTAFNVSNNNTELSSVDGVIYNKDVTKLVRYPIAKQGTFTIPSTVTSLGDYNQDPFIYCDGITTIEIGLNVSRIYPANFSRCSSLTAINVDANNQTYSSISGVLYNKNASKLIRCPEGKQSVTIPNTVTELGDDSFIWCANITTIDIPNSVTTIGYSAFDYCTNLSTITIPSSVTSVEDCYNFDGCTSLPVINDIRYADTYAIRCTSSGKSTYTIKSGTRFIGNCAFEGQGNLQNITIPSTVIAMGDYVFDSCSKLETITFEGMTAPDVHRDTFRGVKSSGGTIRVPANSTGYDVIMQKNGLSNWTKVEY